MKAPRKVLGLQRQHWPGARALCLLCPGTACAAAPGAPSRPTSPFGERAAPGLPGGDSSGPITYSQQHKQVLLIKSLLGIFPGPLFPFCSLHRVHLLTPLIAHCSALITAISSERSIITSHKPFPVVVSDSNGETKQITHTHNTLSSKTTPEGVT